MSEPNTYDEVPYPDLAFPQTHPNRTGALASLFGASPADPGAARVLELGCAAGANLLPMGVEFPDATFLGLDLSSAQIAAGEAVRREARIENVSLQQADILQLDGALGQFDYIIAHGLFSWVPPVVADQVLKLCRQCLAPNGIAYVSYNVFPGWHFRGAMRGMMMYHAAGFADPRTRIHQSRALMDFLASSVRTGFYGDMLKAGTDMIRREDDNYLYHEYLETENHPVYFQEFIERVRASGLAYLTGTQLPTAAARALGPETERMLRQVAGGDPIRMEQYLDFLTNRTFRESLLVHSELPVAGEPDWTHLRNLWITHALTPAAPRFDPMRSAPEVFESRSGVKLSLRDPFVKTALAILLEERSRPMAFADILAAVRHRIRSARPAGEDEAALGKFLLELLSHGVAEIIARPWPGAATIAERPSASRLARNQARSGRTIVTLRHQRLDEISPDHRRLVELLDGETTVEQAIDGMFGKIDWNRLPESARGATNDPAKLRALFGDAMHRAVADLRDLGLFMDCG